MAIPHDGLEEDVPPRDACCWVPSVRAPITLMSVSNRNTVYKDNKQAGV